MAIQIGWQQASEVRRQLEALLGRRRAGQHLAAVVGASQSAIETGTEHVEGLVVAIRPHAHLRIIVQVGARGIELVQPPAAGRIAGLGHRHALRIVGSRFKGELRDDPTLRGLVVHDRTIAVVVLFARTTKTMPERVGRNCAQHRHLGGLVEHRESRVDHLHILGCADRTHRVRRRAIDRVRT